MNQKRAPENPLAQSSPEQILNIMRILWVALNVSMGVFAVVVFSTRPVNFEGSYLPNFNNSLEMSLTVVAFVVYFIGTLLSAVLLRKGSTKLQAIGGRDPSKALVFSFVPFLLYLAMNEAAVLFGFVIAYGSEAQKILPFLALSFLRNLKVFPRSAEKFQQAIERGKF